MSSVERQELPGDALLRRYLDDGAYADCFATNVAGSVTHAQFVEAFYTTPLFKTERIILRWLVSKPSSDEDVRRLASGKSDTFAAWYVESRAENQILLCDFRERTRSWLMVAPADATTHLYFGSAVVPIRKNGLQQPDFGFTYRALLRFHRLYSVALLSAARSRLAAQHEDG